MLNDRGPCRQRLPGWILAVLPRFRYSFILLLIESRRWADINNINNRALPFKWKSCIIPEIQIFLKLANTASIQPGSLWPGINQVIGDSPFLST